MKRITSYLTEEQVEALHRYADRAGLKYSEVLRRVVDEWRQRLPPDTPRTPKEHDHAED